MGMISIDDQAASSSREGEGGLVRTNERAATRCTCLRVGARSTSIGNLIRIESQAGCLALLRSRGSACLSCGKT